MKKRLAVPLLTMALLAMAGTVREVPAPTPTVTGSVTRTPSIEGSLDIQLVRTGPVTLPVDPLSFIAPQSHATPVPTPTPTPTPLPTLSTPTVAQARAWAMQTLSPADWYALDHIVDHESRWKADAVNPRSGACGLGQFWPCAQMSATLPDWRVQPLAQLRDYVIPYALKRYGSLPNAWRYWCVHGRW